MADQFIKDLCLNCGKYHEREYGGANCSCGAGLVVHQYECDGCERIIGLIIDDDACVPDTLYCPDCMDRARNKNGG